MRVENFLLHVLEQAKKTAMKKKRSHQTSIATHPVHTTEANAKRAEIIATLYTERASAHRHPCGQFESKGLTLGHRGSISSTGMENL
jgi:hypothetical protein